MIHNFIFKPGVWEGVGKISFSMADDELPFRMRWSVSPQELGSIRFSQLVEVENFSDPLTNNFTLSGITSSHFVITLENDLVGKVEGKGLYSEKLIAWEFRNAAEGFEGYEIYELQTDGTYKMRAEFMGGEEFRTFVAGTIKLKNG
jgi:hypothetical protein